MRVFYCNKCGKELGLWGENINPIELTMGYGSKYDGEIVVLDLCSDCFDELIDSCKISPIVKAKAVDTYNNSVNLA